MVLMTAIQNKSIHFLSHNNLSNMVITFGNQKGGVGKTTLCTLFASYLAEKGKRTLVVDCDNQQTISEKRKMDEKKYPDTKIPYLVQAFDISKMENVSNMMRTIQNMKGMVLIDSPGNLTQQGLIPIFVKSDYVVCPFQYEPTSINSTVTFILFLMRLKEKFPTMKAELFFIVNKHDKRCGKKQELELWAKTEERLSHYGHVAPKVESKMNMQRYNTMGINYDQRDIISPTFDFIYNNIFGEEKQ